MTAVTSLYVTELLGPSSVVLTGVLFVVPHAALQTLGIYATGASPDWALMYACAPMTCTCLLLPGYSAYLAVRHHGVKYWFRVDKVALALARESNVLMPTTGFLAVFYWFCCIPLLLVPADLRFDTGVLRPWLVPVVRKVCTTAIDFTRGQLGPHFAVWGPWTLHASTGLFTAAVALHTKTWRQLGAVLAVDWLAFSLRVSAPTVTASSPKILQLLRGANSMKPPPPADSTRTFDEMAFRFYECAVEATCHSGAVAVFGLVYALAPFLTPDLQRLFPLAEGGKLAALAASVLLQDAATRVIAYRVTRHTYPVVRNPFRKKHRMRFLAQWCVAGWASVSVLQFGWYFKAKGITFD